MWELVKWNNNQKKSCCFVVKSSFLSLGKRAPRHHECPPRGDGVLWGRLCDRWSFESLLADNWWCFPAVTINIISAARLCRFYPIKRLFLAFAYALATHNGEQDTFGMKSDAIFFFPQPSCHLHQMLLIVKTILKIGVTDKGGNAKVISLHTNFHLPPPNLKGVRTIQNLVCLNGTTHKVTTLARSWCHLLTQFHFRMRLLKPHPLKAHIQYASTRRQMIIYHLWSNDLHASAVIFKILGDLKSIFPWMYFVAPISKTRWHCSSTSGFWGL